MLQGTHHSRIAMSIVTIILNIMRTNIFFGGKWYDWGMIQFQNDKIENATCPCLILGFVEFKTPGCPTPTLINDKKLSSEEIAESNMTDDTQYVVVWAAKKFVSQRDMQENFVVKWQLGPAANHMYIVDVEALLQPLFVIPDGRDFLGCLPYREWPSYFTSEISLL